MDVTAYKFDVYIEMNIKYLLIVLVVVVRIMQLLNI